MSAREVPGTWDTTYRKWYAVGQYESGRIEITTALSDRLSLVSDLEIHVRTHNGRAQAMAEIRLTAQEMRDLSAMLLQAADRVDELEQMRQCMLAELEQAEQAEAAA